MRNVVLISDDVDFFDYIKTLLSLRQMDNIFCLSFDDILSNYYLIEQSVLVINSENSHEKTLELLKIFNNSPILVVAYNENPEYRLKYIENGAFDYITLVNLETDLNIRIRQMLKIIELYSKKEIYRKFLINKNILRNNNEIFINYHEVLDIALDDIKRKSQKAVLVAISSGDGKSKFLLNQNDFEQLLLNNIRESDIIMSYTPNKFFVLMFDIDMKTAKMFWNKILKKTSYHLYLGYCLIKNQAKEHIINYVLKNLQDDINSERYRDENNDENEKEGLSDTIQPALKKQAYNFKSYRQNFIKNIDSIITPVFYQLQQRYEASLLGVNIVQSVKSGTGVFTIQGKFFSSSLKITCAGFSKINIDITFQRNNELIDSKRITLEASEIEQGILNDIMEQFLLEYKNKERV